MPIVVTCPSCSTTLKAPDTAAGKRVKCPKCTSPIDVPAAAPPLIIEEVFSEEPPPAPARADAVPLREEREVPDAPPPPMGQINRQTVGLVAVLPTGALGVHKFILGKSQPAFIMLLVAVFGCGIGFFVMWAIGIMEGVKYLQMSDDEFYATYVAGDKAWQ